MLELQLVGYICLIYINAKCSSALPISLSVFNCNLLALHNANRCTGHGFSSHIPMGMGYHFIEGISYIKRVANHFGLERFNLMGHSMGGAMCAVFAATFPNEVLRLIELDALLPIQRPVETAVERTKSSVEQMLTFEEKIVRGSSPTYSYDEAKTKLLEDYSNFHGQECLTSHAADALLLRGLTKSSNTEDNNKTFTFSRDVRHRVPGIYGYPSLMWQEFGKRISCPHLVVSAEPKPSYFDPGTAEASRKVCEDSNADFSVQVVSGTHFVRGHPFLHSRHVQIWIRSISGASEPSKNSF